MDVARISVGGREIQQKLLNKDFWKFLKDLYKIRTKILKILQNFSEIQFMKI